MTLQELQDQVLQLPLRDRWQLVQYLLSSIQQETLNIDLPDAAFPQIELRVGSSDLAQTIIKGTGVRVQTIVIANADWGWDVGKIAEEYSLSSDQVAAALMFYEVHKTKIDGVIASEVALETAAHG